MQNTRKHIFQTLQRLFCMIYRRDDVFTLIYWSSVHSRSRIYGTSFCPLSGHPWGKPSSDIPHTALTSEHESFRKRGKLELIIPVTIHNLFRTSSRCKGHDARLDIFTTAVTNLQYKAKMMTNSNPNPNMNTNNNANNN